MARKSRDASSKGTTKKVGKKPVERGARKEKAAPEASFPIVGIGASAGGLQALESFFAGLPASCNMAFVIVQHLDPHHVSLMNSLLSKETPLAVNDITDGTLVEPNQVYIKPPGRDVIIRDRTLYLREVKGKEGARLPIDTFFRSLAADQKEKAVCVIMTGASQDGTLGAKLIKGEGGMVMVQDEQQAQYPRMPRSVIDAGLADLILPVEKMPEHLLRLVDHPFMVPEPSAPAERKLEQELHSILMIVRTHTGHDFSQYKQNTVVRRIQRRMALNQIDDIIDYRRYLRQNAPEVRNLFKDLTINVTSFFRDHEAFVQLSEIGIKPLMKDQPENAMFRVWVPGCATGEEAYSLAILLVEAAEALKRYFEIKIFATDINTDAIEAARSGEYPENIQADISEERLKRFFTKRGDKYNVDSKIRDLMVFAIHDVTRDPPFSNMELISCRNLLIYMGADLQKRVLPILHYGLNPGGVLFLGTSETAGEAAGLFAVLDKKNKIYRHRDVEVEPMYRFQVPRYSREEEEEEEEIDRARRERQAIARRKAKVDVREIVERAILAKYATPAVLLDDGSDIVYFHGDASRFLSLPVGEPSYNVFALTHGDLHFRLSQAVEKAKKSRKPVLTERVQVRSDEDFLSLDLVCTPLFSKKDMRGHVLVEFLEHRREEPPEAREQEHEDHSKDPAVSELEQKLHMTRQELQAAIEELETANEELKSSNEELQANNEELQSTNEELESSKEELQSTNEELETVNTELSKKNQDIKKAEDDLKNLFASSGIGTLFLDNDLIIKRFTPAAKELFNLKEDRDIGRSIRDITSNLDYDAMGRDAEEVLDRLVRKEIKVRGRNGGWYAVRIVPYRTQANVIEGVVITFLDVTQYENNGE